MIDEIWIETNNISNNGNTIIAVSNRGRIKRKNGNPPEESTLRQQVFINGKITLIHRFIAEHFIPKTDEDIELGRNQIDHRTHEPTDMNVNDTRNLRWCTNKENTNFEECRENKSKALLNKPKSEFGRKYIEHYGYSFTENIQQYRKEWKYYHHKGKCSWE